VPRGTSLRRGESLKRTRAHAPLGIWGCQYKAPGIGWGTRCASLTAEKPLCVG
jgi:hypothetical protein